MTAPIEVLGCEAKQTGEANYQAITPIGSVVIFLGVDDRSWTVLWWPRGARRCSVDLSDGAQTAADAAREATRRLRAIQRTCARAGAV